MNFGEDENFSSDDEQLPYDKPYEKKRYYLFAIDSSLSDEKLYQVCLKLNEKFELVDNYAKLRNKFFCFVAICGLQKINSKQLSNPITILNMHSFINFIKEHSSHQISRNRELINMSDIAKSVKEKFTELTSQKGDKVIRKFIFITSRKNLEIDNYDDFHDRLMLLQIKFVYALITESPSDKEECEKYFINSLNQETELIISTDVNNFNDNLSNMFQNELTIKKLKFFINDIDFVELEMSKVFLKDYRNDRKFFVREKKIVVLDENAPEKKISSLKVTAKYINLSDNIVPANGTNRIIIDKDSELRLFSNFVWVNLMYKDSLHLLWLEQNKNNHVQLEQVKSYMLKFNGSKTNERSKVFGEAFWKYLVKNNLLACCRYQHVNRSLPIYLKPYLYENKPVLIMYATGFSDNYASCDLKMKRLNLIENNNKPEVESNLNDIMKCIVTKLNTGVLPTDILDPKKQCRDTMIEAKRKNIPFDFKLVPPDQASMEYHQVDDLIKDCLVDFNLNQFYLSYVSNKRKRERKPKNDTLNTSKITKKND